MSHHCRICGRQRANEMFSGKGHTIHVCKECMRLPAEKRRHIEEMEEIIGFLDQSNISEKNLNRLGLLAGSSDEKIAQTARIIFEIGKVHPRKRKRFQFLAKANRDLLDQVEGLGLIDDSEHGEG